MGTSKTEKFSEYQNEVADLAKALSHPARIAILQYIAQQDQCICGEIVDEIGLAQSTVSQHLKELKTAGIIQGNIEGVKTCYCLNAEKWEKIKDLFSGFMNLSKKSCC